jgi:hypothetical protein
MNLIIYNTEPFKSDLVYKITDLKARKEASKGLSSEICLAESGINR